MWQTLIFLSSLLLEELLLEELLLEELLLEELLLEELLLEELLLEELPPGQSAMVGSGSIGDIPITTERPCPSAKNSPMVQPSGMALTLTSIGFCPV
jgi:hypothetical protein